MEANPYKSPLFAPLGRQATEQKPRPLWRRLLALPVIIFGMFLVVVAASVIAALQNLDPAYTNVTRAGAIAWAMRVVAAAVVLPVGIGTIWFGSRLIRRHYTIKRAVVGENRAETDDRHGASG